MRSVSSCRKASEKCSLNLPPQENVEPVDYILYDLVEGMTLIVIGATPSSLKEKVRLPICSRPFAYGGPS